MKKIISIISSLALLVALAPMSFAAKGENPVGTDPQVQIKFDVSAATLPKTGSKPAPASMTLSVTVTSGITLETDAYVTNQEEIDDAIANEEEDIPDPEYEILSATGINALQLYYKFADGVVDNSAGITNTASFKAYDNTNKKLGGTMSLINDVFTAALMSSGADAIATANPVAKAKVSLTDSFYNSLDASAKTSATTLKAALQAKLEDGTLGQPTRLEDWEVSFQTFEDGDLTMETTVGHESLADSYDYAIKKVLPEVSSSPVVPEYKTEKTKEIMETKAGTYAAEPTVDDTGKGLYWLINFKQQATDQYISADIQRFNSSGELLKQQSILVKLDDDGDSNKFVGEGDRAAYIFMENVPAGKYKGAFYISATGKPEDSIPLFYDKNFIVVE